MKVEIDGTYCSRDYWGYDSGNKRIYKKKLMNEKMGEQEEEIITESDSEKIELSSEII